MRKRYRSKKYLNWIKTKDCLAGGAGEVQPHHCRTGFICGTGLKPDDYLTIPLSLEMHTSGPNAIHVIGEKAFFEKYNINPKIEITNLLLEAVTRMGYIEPSPRFDYNNSVGAEKFFDTNYEYITERINLSIGGTKK